VELVAIAIVLGVAALWLVVARGGLSGARFTITIHGVGLCGVRIRGTVPGHALPDVTAFVAELGLPRGARIQGIPSGGRIELRFSPTVPEHLHQRLRNFFFSRMR
jgi:hypothetical protein